MGGWKNDGRNEVLLNRIRVTSSHDGDSKRTGSQAKAYEPRFREETPVTRQVEEPLLYLAVRVRAFR
jgi:hypothetical protein